MNLKEVIKGLKREYGTPIIIYNANSILDVETGIKDITYSYIEIKRAIVLPPKLGSQVMPVGLVDIANTVILIDIDDLNDFKINSESWVTFKDRRFVVAKITEYDDAVQLEVTETKGEQFVLFRPKTYCHSLKVTASLEVEHVQS